MKRVLMVAYHFPPLAGSSGIQRTLRFVRHLPEFGWDPVVLSAHPRAYERTSDDLQSEIPASVPVARAFALDTAKHLAVGGWYPAFLARPDRWLTWRFGAVPAGLRLIREFDAALIWSTFPIATAHVIGAALHRRTGLPWIADFRDPMAQEGYPAEPALWRSFKAIEERTVRRARFCTFTAPGAARDYRARYPDCAPRIVVLENGYDEESFVGVSAGAASREPLNPGAATLLHSGVVYPVERDPTHLFAALAQLRDAGRLSPGSLIVRFRASDFDAYLTDLAQRLRVTDFVQCMPPLAYRAALEEMVRADGLLVLQASNCNEQIPAKLYEYLRARRPIVALTDPAGDTAAVLRDAGLDAFARLDAPAEIAALIGRFVDSARAEGSWLPRADRVATASRRERTRVLAALFDEAAASA